ncbi:MAG: outer membrane beta-barrel protein [Agriterribacter sp.]
MFYKFKHIFFLVSVLLVSNLIPGKAKAQDVSTLGRITGKVKDSVFNFMLPSATIAIYEYRDSSLVKFSLPNNFGEFSINSLPIHVPLRLVITHIGYLSYSKKIEFTEAKKQIDLGLVYMLQNGTGTTEKEVVITAIAPVRINRDTIEFNADAFKLDSNATAEDLMRSLPGFTVWGNGDITYNGKKINSILVEGKPFMGGRDITIATQNLPKSALKKIQVYRQGNEKNPLDSTLNANIKLKEGAKMGYFGKLSAGYGTQKRFAADGMISGYNRKLQVSAIGAVNNINKMATNIDQLLKNSSYKGEGVSNDYQSDFSMRGLNKPASAGAQFQYDFIPEASYMKSNRLNADYFLVHNNSLKDDNTTSRIFLSTDSILTRNSRSRTIESYTNQSLNARYEKSTEQMLFEMEAVSNNNSYQSQSESQEQQEITNAEVIGTGLSKKTFLSNSKDVSIDAKYSNRSMWDGIRRRIPREFTMEYNFSANNSEGKGSNISDYWSKGNLAGRIKFDRLYNSKDSSGVSHTVKATYPGLMSLIFGAKNMGGVKIGVSTLFRAINEGYFDHVLDRDTANSKYVENTYLTNKRRIIVNDFIPSFNISKVFSMELTNRYSKYVRANVNLKNQYYTMRHNSLQDVQNLSYRYVNFIPDANIEFHNHQYGNNEANYKLDFSTMLNYPDIQMLAPLIDSTNLWYIAKGNKLLKPEYVKKLGVSYEIDSRKPKNPMGVKINLNFGWTRDKITDSLIYDSIGRQIAQPVNMNNYQFLNGDIAFRKAVQIKKSTLEMTTFYRLYTSNSPQYINGLLNSSHMFNQNGSVSVNFRYKALVNMRLEEGINLYNSKQRGFDDKAFNSTNLYTYFSGTLQFPKSLIWSSNVTYNKSSSNSINPVYFIIWNASLAYRFMKGNQGEIKFSALDLLKQNKGLINSSNGNSQIFTNSNVLQQYFMVTLSYYPRKFGK